MFCMVSPMKPMPPVTNTFSPRLLDAMVVDGVSPTEEEAVMLCDNTSGSNVSFSTGTTTYA